MLTTQLCREALAEVRSSDTVSYLEAAVLVSRCRNLQGSLDRLLKMEQARRG